MPESSTIAEPMSDNQALREILGELRSIDSTVRDNYDKVTGVEKAITNVDPLTRPADPNIVKTAVTNTGGSEATISEDGVVVNVLQSKMTWVSPMSGSGVISVTTESNTVVTIATYTKE